MAGRQIHAIYPLSHDNGSSVQPSLEALQASTSLIKEINYLSALSPSDITQGHSRSERKQKRIKTIHKSVVSYFPTLCDSLFYKFELYLPTFKLNVNFVTSKRQ